MDDPSDYAASFAPVASPSARVLILGSIPGRASLQAQQYYAHPRNQFWPLMAALFSIASDAPYAARLKALQSQGIALWDVMHSCERPGSLDASIDASTVLPNDFADFFARHPSVRTVCFNGATAADTYRRHVLPGLADVGMHYVRLPSTSPAHAARSFEQKLATWRHSLKGAA